MLTSAALVIANLGTTAAEFAESLRRLLRPGGLLLNHGITRASPLPWDKKSFVARFVFPDGELESVGTVIGALEGAVHAFERGDISVHQVLAAVSDAPRCAPGRRR